MTGRASGLSNGLARMRLNRRELLKQFSAGSGLLSLTALLSRQGEMSAGAVALSSPIDGLTLAEAGKAIACIVVAKTADTAEQNAAAELAHYLRLITDVDFKIHTEDDLPKTGSRIYIGPTASAALHGIDWHSLSPEEWIVRTVGKDLLIIGGRPRGTSYGVYHFLEEILGVHWWNPFEESVPHRTNLRIDSLSMKGKPEFPYRDIYMLFGHDDGRFAASIDDVRASAFHALRHRVLLNFEGEAEGVKTDQVIDAILKSIVETKPDAKSEKKGQAIGMA